MWLTISCCCCFLCFYEFTGRRVLGGGIPMACLHTYTTMSMRRSKDNLQNSSLSFCHAGSRTQTQAVRLGSEQLDCLCYLARVTLWFLCSFHMVPQEHVLWKDVNMLKCRFCGREDRASWLGRMLICLSGWFQQKAAMFSKELQWPLMGRLLE